MTTVVGQATTDTEESIQLYQAIIDLAAKSPSSIPEDLSILNVKQALVFKRQLLLYLDALQDQMIRSRSTLLSLSTKFDKSVIELKATCRAKTAVPVDQVYVI